MSAPGAAPVAHRRPAPSPRFDEARRRAAPWARDHLALLVLLVVPFAVFGLPILFGHTVLDGDNYIQNFPLRVLVGGDLDHGMLPLWNPYLFSGTPLLAGFNAGAAYPATWLMAGLPVFVAWALAFAAVYDLALAGMYLFLRRQGIGGTAATFGAATFAFSGYMTAQIVHVDLIQGTASLPWMLLAVHGLTGRAASVPARDTNGPARLRAGLVGARGSIALLAVAFGLSVLSGGVEAAIDGAVLLLIYWVGRLVALGCARRRDGWAAATAAVTLLLGLAGGVVLGAAQLLPGAAFLSTSQRSGSSYTFFTSGSLPERLLTLLVSPFALGTNQTRPAFYNGPYNFQEVTSYVGVLALIAACVLLVRRWRTRPEARHWRVWYVVLAFGVLGALGNQTPFGYLLYVVPGLNDQRLLNRNLLLVDCALAVLLAWWSHLLLTQRDHAAGPTTRPIRSRWRPGGRAELVATVLPFGVSVVICLSLWVAGPLLDHALEAAYPVGASTRFELAPLVTGGTIIAGVATWIVLAERRFSTRTLRRLLAAVLAADLLLFDLFVIRVPISEAAAQARGPASTAFRATVGDGRFIIFDTDQFFGDELLALGQTDLNLFTRVRSAQGYTALTDGVYYHATGAHLQEDLAPSSLIGPVWDALNVSTLLSVPSYFVTPAPGAPVSGYPFPGDVLSGGATRFDGPFTVNPGTVRRWYFGGLLTVGRWSFPLERESALGPVGLRVGLLSPTGQIQWIAPSVVHVSTSQAGHTVDVALPSPVAAGGVVIQTGSAGRLVVGAPTAATAEAGTVRLDGRMQPAINASHWDFAGALGSFGVFHNRRAEGWAWLAGKHGGTAPAGSTVSAPGPGRGGGQPITVHATGPLALDRSEAWATGWRATVRALDRPGSRGTPATVTRDGLVQRVDLPGPGVYRVTFTYAPSEARTGIVVSAVATALFVLWGLVELWLLWRHRRRRGSMRSPAVSRG